MTEWAFVLMPLLVLPIVLLFRFVGCGIDFVASGVEVPLPTRVPATPPTPPVTPDIPPNYKSTILLEASVKAYWRLVDVSITDAKNEKGPPDGEYKQGYVISPVTPTGSNAGSEGRTSAKLTPGKHSLIDSDWNVMCRDFDGGHVRVNSVADWFKNQFTIEAWISAKNFMSAYEYTLFHIGDPYSPPSTLADRGFRLLVNRQNRWQVRLGQSSTDLFPNAPLLDPTSLVPLGRRTHVALTMVDVGSGGQKKFSLYVDGKAVTPVTVSGYKPPDNAPLFIGIENKQPNPLSPATLRHPILCDLQEVVVHDRALSQAEIKNHVDINRSYDPR